MTDARTLRSLHDEVRTVAHELADTFQRKVIREDRTTTTHALPPLIEQLRAAKATSRGRGKGLGGTPLPIDPDAVELLHRIETDARRLHVIAHATHHDIDAARARRAVPPRGVEADIRGIAAFAGLWAEQARVETVLRYLRGWHTEILALLDPQSRLAIAARCPDCDTRMVWRPDSTGQLVQTDALVWDPQFGGCVCLGCGCTWAAGQLEHLARVIDDNTIGATA